jgi:hypothetical protein
MQYQIIAAHTLDTLQSMVNNEMRYQWEVTGGLITFRKLVGNHEMTQQQKLEIFFAQAMIRSSPQPQGNKIPKK